MKKYIRTQDGIWLFGGTHHMGEVIIGKKREIDFGYCFDKTDVIDQADKIEDLCDDFVVWDHSNKNPVNMPLIEKEWGLMKKSVLIGMNIGMECWLKLAIWTDKGLIYVAKMNEKGDLELL